MFGFSFGSGWIYKGVEEQRNKIFCFVASPNPTTPIGGFFLLAVSLFRTADTVAVFYFFFEVFYFSLTKHNPEGPRFFLKKEGKKNPFLPFLEKV